MKALKKALNPANWKKSGKGTKDGGERRGSEVLNSLSRHLDTLSYFIWYKKALEAPAPSPSDEQAVGVRDFKRDPFGLAVLHPPMEIEDEYHPHVEYALYPAAGDPAHLVVSIVAVHGLGGTAKGTWTDGKIFWLEDLLPVSFPNSRIMTFGYNSQFAFSVSKAGIDSFARTLLTRLRLRRNITQVRKRSSHLCCPCKYFDRVSLYLDYREAPDFHRT